MCVSAYVAHKLQLLDVKWSEQRGMEMDNALRSKQWNGRENLGCNRTKSIELSVKNEGGEDRRGEEGEPGRRETREVRGKKKRGNRRREGRKSSTYEL